jgi:hypothetical protein
MYIVIVGNIHMGYTYWGPFKSQDDAEAYIAERRYTPAYVAMARIYPPIKD